MVLELGFDLGR